MMKKRCMAVWIILGLLLSMLPVSANTQQNAKSLSVNGTVSGSITEAEEVNWYQVNIPSAGRLRFQITSTMNLLGIAFFDSNQKMICTDEVEDIQGKSKTLDFYLEKGSYYVRVVGYYGEYDHSYYYGNYSFQTKFTASGTNRSRNNNSFKTAVKIPTKAKVVGQISANHPFEYFKISLPSSGRLEVKGTSYLEYFGIRIYDSKYNKLDGETIEKDAASKKGTFTKQYDLQKGTYYIWTIGNYEGGTEARYYGKYKFNTKFVSAKVNHKEPNNTIKKAEKIREEILNCTRNCRLLNCNFK